MRPSNFVQVFFDTEFTRNGQNTTLISIGLVTEHHSLYLEFNDYDERQTDQWLRENVLNKLEGKDQVSSDEGRRILEEWFDKVRDGNKIQLISAGKGLDLILLYNLWGRTKDNNPLRGTRGNVPDFLGHHYHIDFKTILYLCGIYPNVDRSTLIDFKGENLRHNALFDAKILHQCWQKFVVERGLEKAFVGT